jgi:hypothetical protein
VLDLTIKSKQKEQSASVFFQCTYSPFSEREKQVCGGGGGGGGGGGVFFFFFELN